VIERLGSGGFGTVYRVRHVHTLRNAALKLLDPDVSTDAATLARFKREAQVATALDNEHIVEVLDWGVLPSGQSFLVMELLEGRDVATAIEADGAFPVGRALEIFGQLLAGLAHVHDAGVIHRDLKPANIFLEGGSHVKLLDFGCCRVESREGQSATRSGVVIGTPLYMAPEQLRGGTADVRSDIYSAAAVFYELVSARRPHEGRSYEDLVARVCTDEPRPLAEVAPNVPPHIGAAIMRGLERDPARRWQSATAFANALIDSDTPRESPAARQLDDKTVPSKPKPSEHPGTPRRPPWALIAVVLVGIGGLLAVQVLRADDLGVSATKPTDMAPSDAAPVSDAARVVTEPATPDAMPGATKPVTEKTRPTEPAAKPPMGRTCSWAGECPRFRCECRNDILLGGGCATEQLRCFSAAAACPKICAKAGGWKGGADVAVPASSEDCAASPQCKRSGACVARSSPFDNGRGCVKSCREMRVCAVDGLCGDIGGDSMACVATSADDCAASENCKTGGSCALADGACVRAK
jgi:serine/threonine protein kinase